MKVQSKIDEHVDFFLMPQKLFTWNTQNRIASENIHVFNVVFSIAKSNYVNL